jgi:uncharacterized protein YbjQ (UPF0145 family)
MDQDLVTTAFNIEGYRIRQNLGVVRGIVVRSRFIFGTIGAGLQTLFGGIFTLFTELCEKTWKDSYTLMITHDEQMGPNGIIGFRYDANDVMSGVTEVLAYGAAVIFEKSK